MPELPEVELVSRELDRIVRGRRIEAAELLRARLAPGSRVPDFGRSLDGGLIRAVHRRGKNILFDLDNGLTLLAHLRMSGRFMRLGGEDDDPKFTHAIFHLDDGTRLIFQDQRHFGLMKVLDTAQLQADPSISKLAPEPFSDAFSVEYLTGRLASCSRSLKEFLLDQTKVCGLGNIYASEAMYRARISPRRKARNVPRTRIESLYQSIRDVLTAAMETVTARVPDPIIIGEGVYGDNVEADWFVYGREGHPCPECATPIRRIRQGARSTYFCPRCQR